MPYYQATHDITLNHGGGLSQLMQAGTMGEIRDLADAERFPGFNRLLANGSLVPVPLDSAGRDNTPLPTDWDNIVDLFDDMERYAREHPTAEFLCADDPGRGVRIPRFGWSAFERDPETGVENSHGWTITIDRLRETRRGLRVAWEQALQTAVGRQEQLRVLVNRARTGVATPATPPPEVYRPTLWDRLNEDG